MQLTKREIYKVLSVSSIILVRDTVFFGGYRYVMRNDCLFLVSINLHKNCLADI